MGAGTGTGGIPTTDKTPERTEILIIYPINNEYNKIKRFKKSVVGYIVGCGYPTRTRTHTRGKFSCAYMLLSFIYPLELKSM